MRAITPVYANPFGLFGELEKEVGKLVGSRPAASEYHGFRAKEEENAWLLGMDLPRVAKEDLSVEVEDGSLKVRWKRKDFFDEAEEEFTKTFALPEGVDPEKIKAKLENGALFVTMGKVEKVKPRIVPVTVQ